MTQQSHVQMGLSRSHFFNAVDEVGSRESRTDTTESKATAGNSKPTHLKTLENLKINKRRCSSSYRDTDNQLRANG